MWFYFCAFVSIISVFAFLTALFNIDFFKDKKTGETPKRVELLSQSFATGFMFIILTLCLKACSDDEKQPVKQSTAASEVSQSDKVHQDQITNNSDVSKDDTATQIKPESIITFPVSGPACITMDYLRDYMEYGIKKENTKLMALFQPMEELQGVPACIMLDKREKYKVLSSNSKDKDDPFGVIEISLPNSNSLNGLWTTDIGVKVIKGTK